MPAEVELTNPRHPLAGQRVPVVSACRLRGGTWLMVTLPDGLPAGVPVGDTELGRAPVATTGKTVLSVAGSGGCVSWPRLLWQRGRVSPARSMGPP